MGLTAGLLVILTLPLLPMVPAWIQTVLDSRGAGGYLYSAKDLPLLMVPVFAYLGRTRTRTPPGARPASAVGIEVRNDAVGLRYDGDVESVVGRPDRAWSVDSWYSRSRGLTRTDAATDSAQPARVGA